MPTDPSDLLNIIGAGGHMLVVVDALLAGGVSASQIRLWDENPALAGERRLGMTIGHLAASSGISRYHVSIGACGARQRLGALFDDGGGIAHTIVHPSAVVSTAAHIGAGTFLAARTVVAPCARIGKGVIVNHGAVVDHECEVGDYCHIAPGVTLGGRVVVGNGVLVGAGANLLPSVRIGDGVVVGAGAVVTRDIREAGVYSGVPARRTGSVE